MAAAVVAATDVTRSTRSMRSVASFLAVACLSIMHLFVKLQYPQDQTQIIVAQQRVCDSSTLLVHRPQQDNATQQAPGRFAYAFIISGCTDTSCLGYVLNAVVAAYVFQNSNSAADMLLMVRMATNHNATHLSEEQESWLHKAGVKLRYLKRSGATASGRRNWRSSGSCNCTKITIASSFWTRILSPSATSITCFKSRTDETGFCQTTSPCRGRWLP